MKRALSFVLGKRLQNNEADLWIIGRHGEEKFLPGQIDFPDIDPIAGGKQGVVYAAKICFRDENNVSQERLCVVKELQSKKFPDAFAQHRHITEEHQTSIEHNVIKLIHYIERKRQKFAVFPYCSLFLKEIIEKLPSNNPSLCAHIALHVMTDLLKALNYLHSHAQFVHGDLKPANVAFYLGCWCVIDLDDAVTLNHKAAVANGTLFYRCPASFVDARYTAKSSNDVYALGVILQELLQIVNQSLYSLSQFEFVSSASTQYEAAKNKHRAQGGRYPALSEELAADKSCDLQVKLSIMAQAMTHPVPEVRPSLSELMNCLEILKKNNGYDAALNELQQFYKQYESKGFFSDKAPISSIFSDSVQTQGVTPEPSPETSPEVSRRQSNQE